MADYIVSELAPHDAVRGVVAIGSVAIGRARSGSDIDAVVFMEPFDPSIAPAESLWRRSDNTYHSIFTDDPDLDRDAIQLDLHRLDLAVWTSSEFTWPEPDRAELAEGWIAYDPAGQIEDLIRARTAMSDRQRTTILDEVVGMLDQMIGLDEDAGVDDSQERWRRLGPAEAFDRLQTGYEALTRGLFAYHGKWRPWRSRELRGLLRLGWLPNAFHDAPTTLVASDGHDVGAYSRRAAALRGAVAQFLQRLQVDGLYQEDPGSEAFIRLHDEPGRSWNMEAWNAQRIQRHSDHEPIRSPRR